jgi:hypothetical protein
LTHSSFYLNNLKEVFPDYAENENILFVADIEQRLKENYHHITYYFSSCSEELSSASKQKA